MTCPECGAYIEEDDEECSNCGYLLNSLERQTAEDILDDDCTDIDRRGRKRTRQQIDEDEDEDEDEELNEKNIDDDDEEDPYVALK